VCRVSGTHSRIALAAAAHIESNQTVILDAGTTVHHLAHGLPDISRLTVFTPAIAIAQQLLGVDGVETHLMGGRVDRDWLETVGAPDEQGIVDLIAHTLFLGAHGVDSSMDIRDLSRDLALNKLQFAQPEFFKVVEASGS
jgi:DeoR family transcriptional regulator, aga operon transcriptional repressor